MTAPVQQMLVATKGISTHNIEIQLDMLPVDEMMVSDPPSQEMINTLIANRCPLAPIQVVEIEVAGLPAWAVVDGRRRVKAQRKVLAQAKREGDEILVNMLSTIPAVVLEGHVFDIRRNALAANFNRSSNYLTEVREILRFIHEDHMTIETIAQSCNLDKAEVAKRAKFAKLTSDLLGLFYDGRLAKTVAESIIKHLSRDEQVALYADWQHRLEVNEKARIAADDVKRFRQAQRQKAAEQLSFDLGDDDDEFSDVAKDRNGDTLADIYSDLQSMVATGDAPIEELADLAERIRYFIKE